jgi:hypothetical protein
VIHAAEKTGDEKSEEISGVPANSVPQEVKTLLAAIQEEVVDINGPEPNVYAPIGTKIWIALIVSISE